MVARDINGTPIRVGDTVRLASRLASSGVRTATVTEIEERFGLVQNYAVAYYPALEHGFVWSYAKNLEIVISESIINDERGLESLSESEKQIVRDTRKNLLDDKLWS